jgi:hypothetical protein
METIHNIPVKLHQALKTVLECPQLLAAMKHAIDNNSSLDDKLSEAVEGVITRCDEQIMIVEDWMRFPADAAAETIACLSCKWWDALTEFDPAKGSVGCCIRYAPRPATGEAPAGGEVNVIWPITRDNDWCGEYTLKP